MDKQINWKQRWDGSAASLACQSRRPHSHLNQHTEAELKLIRDMRRRNPKLGHDRALAPSAAARLYTLSEKSVACHAQNEAVPRRKVECVQTDNGFKFTNRFSGSKRDLPTLFEKAAAELGIRHELIRPYTLRHNGKAECSHREDQERFYSCHAFYSLDDFAKQLSVTFGRMRWAQPLHFPKS